MKTIISLIALIFCQYTFAQNFYSDISEKSKYNITVRFKNNDEKQYNNAKLSRLYTGMELSNSILPSLKPLSIKKLKKQKVVIKPNRKGKIKISKDSISELIVELVENKNVSYTFKNVTIKGVDDDLNIVTLAENILLPLRYSDTINIYGFRIFSPDNDIIYKNGFARRRMMPPTLEGVYYFLSHSGSNVAMNPIDFSGGMFKTKLISDKFVATLKEIGKDCDAFVASYENYSYAKVSKEQAKAYMNSYKKKTKEIEKRAKKLSKKEKERFLRNEYERLFVLDNYIKIIEAYNKACNQ
jgi:hypothetical protein